MEKFQKGYTYLVQVNKHWYVVNQTGMKSWNATVFTHWCVNCAEVSLSGNSIALMQKLQALQGDETKITVLKTFGTEHMRKYMFNILKTGQPTIGGIL